MSNPNQLCFYVVSKAGKAGLNPQNALVENASGYQLFSLAHWQTEGGEALTLYRIGLTLRLGSDIARSEAGEMTVFAVGRAGLEETEPELANDALWRLRFTCSTNDFKLEVTQVTTGARQTLATLQDVSSLSYSKLVSFCLEKTQGQRESLVHEARGQALADLVINK